MLFYYLFWISTGFIIHFYITFGTNLLTGGTTHIVVLLPVLVFRRKGISNGVQTEWNLWERIFSGKIWSRRLGPYVKKQKRRPRGRGAPTPPPRARPPPSWAPCCSTDVPLPPIYTYVPPNDQIRSQKPNSTAATFCTHEIPSWGLFRSSAGGGIHHVGLLHQHHSPSDEVWVVYLRPTGP